LRLVRFTLTLVITGSLVSICYSSHVTGNYLITTNMYIISFTFMYCDLVNGLQASLYCVDVGKLYRYIKPRE